MANGTKEIQNKPPVSNIEYKPLTGVSFKPSHSSDVEIVGVKLGNQTIQDQASVANSNHTVSNQKKKNSLKCTFFKNLILKTEFFPFSFKPFFFYNILDFSIFLCRKSAI